MPIRVTGMISGMDTESMVQQLVEAKSYKLKEAKGDQKKLGWKQEKWNELNKDIKKLFSGAVSNMRFESAFMKKTTEVSNSNVASVISSDKAMNTTQTLKVTKLAKAGYLTGANLQEKYSQKDKLTSGTKISDLDSKLVGKKISVTVDGKPKEIEITDDMTIGKLVNKLSEGGVNANFDSATQRIFIGAKDTGSKANFTLGGDSDALAALGLNAAGGGNKIEGQDAEIYLNGAKFTSTSNTFEVNGLTITAKEETGDNAVTLTTKNDTSGIYDMIKSFIKDYSELINKIDKLYNADSAAKYKMLTDEEKEAMSETEIEEWEDHIKDSLLRRDENLSSVSSMLKEAMLAGFTVNGKTMTLASFGIETAGYFNAAENEKNAYHIYGDQDDDVFASKDNILKEMIDKDPQAVTSFFSQLAKSLYDSMNKMSASVKDTRSYGSFFDDTKLKNDYKNYDDRIDDLEAKLNAYEDKWYAKFAAMEKAMSKMQTNASAITGMLGGNQ